MLADVWAASIQPVRSKQFRWQNVICSLESRSTEASSTGTNARTNETVWDEACLHEVLTRVQLIAASHRGQKLHGLSWTAVILRVSLFAPGVVSPKHMSADLREPECCGQAVFAVFAMQLSLRVEVLTHAVPGLFCGIWASSFGQTP